MLAGEAFFHTGWGDAKTCQQILFIGFFFLVGFVRARLDSAGAELRFSVGNGRPRGFLERVGRNGFFFSLRRARNEWRIF